jgi:hypothetical protein
MECAICLNAIRREDEAWLIPCWHFFCLKVCPTIAQPSQRGQHTAKLLPLLLPLPPLPAAAATVLQCIQGWTDQQRRHPPGDACPPEQRCVYPCPLCRQRYTHIVTDSIGTSCRCGCVVVVVP